MARDKIKERFTGYGVIQPGAGGDYDHPAIPTPGDFFGGIVKKLRGAQATRDSLANAQADRSAQLRGETAYYQGSSSKTKGILAYRGGRARG